MFFCVFFLWGCFVYLFVCCCFLFCFLVVVVVVVVVLGGILSQIFARSFSATKASQVLITHQTGLQCLSCVSSVVCFVCMFWVCLEGQALSPPLWCHHCQSCFPQQKRCCWRKRNKVAASCPVQEWGQDKSSCFHKKRTICQGTSKNLGGF